MTLALLHRRLTAALALSALLAFAAGAGISAGVLVVGAVLAATAVRLPPPAWSARVEQAARLGILGLCAWMLYVAFILRQDFMPAVMAMLLFLLVAESARSLDARNDTRLYLLSFSLLLASTAFYPGLGFAGAFAAFVVLGTLALTAGYLRRQAERFEVPGVRLGRRMAVTIAVLSLGTLLLSATLFVLFPRLPRQWNVQGRRPAGEMMAGFGNEVRLGQHGGRIGSNPQTAFRVEFLDGPPANPAATYWRGRAFDEFDGVRWSRSRGMDFPVPQYGFYRDRWQGPAQRFRIFGGPPETRVLFAPHAALSVQPRSAIRVLQQASGDIVFDGSDAPVYTVVSTARQPSDDALRALPADRWRDPERYLQLPPLDPAVRRLADSLTAGAEHRIDRVRAVERYLSTELAYSLDLPATARDATVEGFLFRRRAGHCEYFSTSMVMLLRSVGIPARNVTGFAGGEWNAFGGYLAVTGNQAHSWVEVWFGGLGWVSFEPTPSSRVAYAEGAAGWNWPMRLWMDGLEYRWYRWVVDYNLERQLTLFARVGDLFSGSGGASPAGDREHRGAPPAWLAVAIGVVVAGGLLRSSGRWRRPSRSPETRAYLALRRAYARAGLGGPGGPLDFAEGLARSAAPGAAPAGEVVELYLAARFGGRETDEETRRRMQGALAAARAALREARPPRIPLAGRRRARQRAEGGPVHPRPPAT